MPPVSAAFLETAWAAVEEVARRMQITVILGTERFVNGALVASSIVINSDGSVAGFQDKIQIDPSEEGLYTPGTERDSARLSGLRKRGSPHRRYGHHESDGSPCQTLQAHFVTES